MSKDITQSKTIAKIISKSSKTDSENILATYISQIKSVPLLNPEDEHSLALLAMEGDEDAKKRLVEANLRLVIKIARSYMVIDVPFMDLIQEGNLGLLRAAEKFDTAKNVRFSTYATWWIRQSIGRYLANKRRTIRMPNRKEDNLKHIQQVYHGLCQKLQRLPRAEEIAVEIGISVEDVQVILGISGNVVSLDASTDDAHRTKVIDQQEDYRFCPVRTLLSNSSREETIKFLNFLKGKERRIIMYRFQFIPNAPRTFKKIGEHLGISAEAVRQIELRALYKIKQNAAALKECVYYAA